MTNYQHIAEKMYAAYSQQAGGLTFDGKPLPSWQELGLERQTCWKAAAEANFTPQPQADTQTAALLERIDCLAESGVCQMTTGGKHAFLKDIRAAIAAAKENK